MDYNAVSKFFDYTTFNEYRSNVRLYTKTFQNRNVLILDTSKCSQFSFIKQASFHCFNKLPSSI